MNLKYSVLMSVYEKENPEYLSEAINSMIEQTVVPDEIVIVKDGVLTNELDFILNTFKEKYPIINIVGYKENKGLGFALNYGLTKCKNELIARMDTDDVSNKDRCAQQLECFKNNPSLDIVGGDISEFIDDQKNIVAYRKVPTNHQEIEEYMKVRCPFNHMTVMFKKQAVVKAGNYKDLFWNEDYYLWIRMLEQGCNMANTGTVLVNVRVGEDMYKRRGGFRYFKSEKYLQDYMLNKHMISFVTYISNVIKRFIVQILLPNKIRGIVFKMFARS